MLCQGNLRPKKTMTSEEDEAVEDDNKSPSDRDSKPPAPISMSMSKQAILKEVRKQKDDYRKQIK